MHDDQSGITPEAQRKIAAARENPQTFAETFLIDPTLQKPFEANYVQRQIFQCNARDGYFCVHRRGGKIQPLYSTVYTPDGPATMGSMSPGTIVCTPNGGVASVVDIHPHGLNQIYKLTLDDGTQVEAGDDHLWEVYTKTCWKGGRGKSRQQYGTKVLTTEEIMNNLTYSYSNRTEYNYKLDGIKPTIFTKKNLPIEPYTLGVLLGDGHLRSHRITSADFEIIERIVDRTGFSPSKKCNTYRLLSKDVKEPLITLNLLDKLSHTKFIPVEYLYSSIEDRLEIVRGLMDTDGHSKKGRRGQVEYCTVSPQLSTDVAGILRSLGCKVRVKESEARYVKNGIRKTTGTKFRLLITIPEGLEIFSLERKKCGGLSKRYLRRAIVKVEKLGMVEMQCISIDHPNHLYLTDNYVPTHNCADGDSLVIDHRTMRPTPIRSLQKATRALAFDFTTNKTVWSEAQWVNMGEKPCIRFLTESGFHHVYSEDHELFCKQRGWVAVRYLLPGDQILAPSKIDTDAGDMPTLDDVDTAIDSSLALDRIPDEVFRYRDDRLHEFIIPLFNQKGRIFAEQELIGFMLWKPEMAKDLHHLLLRTGIASRIDKDGNLFVSNHIDRSLFMRMYGENYPVTEVHSPRRWETILEKKSAGMRPVYDVCVGHPDHCFLADDIVVSNSYSLSLIALWHAIREPNRKILFFAPSTTQVDDFFAVLRSWVDNNPVLQALKSSGGDHKNPHQRITFENKSYIAGYILGVASNVESSRRGLTGDIILIDEGQDLSDKDWDVVMPIIRGDKTRRDKIRSYISGTLKEPVGEFYKKVEKVGDTKRSKVIKIPIDENPDWTPEEIEEERIEVNNQGRWEREYLLQVGAKEKAVFKKDEIEHAFAFDYEYGPHLIDYKYPRILTVDWDKVQCGTNIAVSQYNPENGAVQVIWREEMPQTQYQYLEACRRVFELFDIYSPELVITDQGHGEVQWEILMVEAQKGGSDLANRLLMCNLGSTIKLKDPKTMEEVKKPIKPFLVGRLISKFQDRRISFPARDIFLVTQFFGYEIKRITKTTTVYSSDNEHVVDCLLFAMYALWLLYENMLDPYGNKSTRPLQVPSELNQSKEEIRETTRSILRNLDGERSDIEGHVVYRGGFDVSTDPFGRF